MSTCVAVVEGRGRLRAVWGRHAVWASPTLACALKASQPNLQIKKIISLGPRAARPSPAEDRHLWSLSSVDTRTSCGHVSLCLSHSSVRAPEVQFPIKAKVLLSLARVRPADGRAACGEQSGRGGSAVGRAQVP